MRLNGANPMFNYDDETQALNMSMNIIIYALSSLQASHKRLTPAAIEYDFNGPFDGGILPNPTKTSGEY